MSCTGREKTVRLLGALGVVALWSTAAFAQSPDVTLRIAHLFTGSASQAPVYKKVLDDWEAAHPEVDLVREETQGDDHRLKLATDLAANNVADIFYNWAVPGDTSKFVESGVALDVREYLEKSPTLSIEDWTPSQIQSVSIDGVPYVLPVQGFECFTLYNTEIFDKFGQVPPTNWDELLATAKVFSDAGIVPIDTGSKGGNPGHLLYNVVLGQMPEGQADAEAAMTTYDVSAPPFREAARLIGELRREKVFPADSIANGDWGPSITLYNQGRAAMLFTCPWMINQIKPEIAEVTKLMYFPTVKGAAVEGRSFNVGHINNGWMINKASFNDPDKQPAIISLLDALQSDEVKKQLIELGTFPGWDAGDLSGYNLTPLAAQVNAFTATSPDTYPGFISFLTTGGSMTAYLEAMDRLFAGDDPDAVFDDFQATVDREKP